MPDYTVGDTVYKRFTTRAFATGIPTALAGTPVVSAYEDDSATQITAGITLGVDHDGVTGLNLLTIVATGGNGFGAGQSYDLVITTGTVGGVSVVGEVVWHFTLSAEAAAVDLANGTDGLGAIKTDTAAILVDTADMQPKLGSPAGASVSADIAAIEAQTDDIGVAGAGLTAIPTIANVTTVATLTGHTAQTGDNFVRLGAPAGASVSADIAVIEAQTDDIGVAGAGLTAIPIHDSNVTQWNGAAVATPTVAGVPEVDVTHMEGGTQTVTDLKDFADAGYDPVTDKVQGVVLADTVTTLTGHTAQTGDSFARLGAPAGASVSADIAVIEADTTSLNDTKIPDTISLANINAQVDAALDTAISELSQAAPAATPTVRTGLMLLYMALRNRLDVTTSGTDELQVFNNAGTVITKKALTDDGSDYSEAQMASGP